MIKSFEDETTEDIFNGVYTHGVRKDFTTNLIKIAERRLDLLNCAESLESLAVIPSMKGEVVRDAHGKHSIPIYQDYRLAFGWNDGAENVEIKSW